MSSDYQCIELELYQMSSPLPQLRVTAFRTCPNCEAGKVAGLFDVDITGHASGSVTCPACKHQEYVTVFVACRFEVTAKPYEQGDDP